MQALTVTDFNRGYKEGLIDAGHDGVFTIIFGMVMGAIWALLVVCTLYYRHQMRLLCVVLFLLYSLWLVYLAWHLRRRLLFPQALPFRGPPQQ